MITTKYSYQIEPRSIELGGGWRLRLLEDDTEAGGGVFPVEVDSDAGIAWWNKCNEQERALAHDGRICAADRRLSRLLAGRNLCGRSEHGVLMA
jgi:hypothetical protein